MLRSRPASAFGEFPAGAERALLPDGVRAKKVLEIFLYGGLSPWETLYHVPEYGQPGDPNYPNTQYYAFKAASDAMVGTCSNGATLSQAFAPDALGANVQLGPFAAKLFTRPDITSRMRICVQRHTLEPHEAAVPQALTGRPVGQPTAAGLGAHIQRARLDAGSQQAAPHSYVFATGGISSDNVSAAASAGAHPGAARPLLIKTDSASGFTSLLARPALGGNRVNHDTLVQAYADQYQKRLTWPSQGRVRSPRTDDMLVAFKTSTNVDAIADTLKTDTGGDLFAGQSGNACGIAGNDIPKIGISAAVHLLTHPTQPASYVCVSDVGIREATGGGGYDTHSGNAHDTAMNFDNILTQLLAMIDPTGADPKKLSLDDTLIILNTEFGRTPEPQGGDGRNHHPYGYATAFIGGPITSAQKGVGGAIGPDGNAPMSTPTVTMFGTPAMNRMAAMLALGMWPFAQEGFAVSDVPGATGELDAALQTIEFYLGRSL